MAQTKYYNTGGGVLFFAPLVDGVYGQEGEFGQTENVAFTTEQETLVHDNTESCVSYEDANILQKVTGTLNIETLEISPDMLTKAFLGTKYTTVVPAGNVSAEGVVITDLDTSYPLTAKFVSAVVVKDDTDTTTYVEGTDYTVNYDDGAITALTGGAISAGDTVHVDFTNEGYADFRIEAFMNSKLEGRLRFTGCSASGLNYTYTFHKISLLSSGDFNLKSPTEFQKLAFEGKMLASEAVVGDGISKLFKIESTEKTV